MPKNKNNFLSGIYWFVIILIACLLVVSFFIVFLQAKYCQLNIWLGFLSFTLVAVGAFLASIFFFRSKRRCVDEIFQQHLNREKLMERMKTEFVSIAAHQLRTPLSANKWILRMFLDGDMGKFSETQSQFLKKTYDSNERMINLVNDLLNVTRIEEGRFLQKTQKVDVVELLQEAVEPFRSLAENKGLKFQLTLPDQKHPDIYVDKEKIILAIQNLLENAVHYTQEGKVAVLADYLPREKEFLIKVQDTGIGIPKDQKFRVFSRFFRSTSALKTETEGTGLGLFIAKNIIEAHGGKIWFESEERKGSAFFFTLPSANHNNKNKEKIA